MIRVRGIADGRGRSLAVVVLCTAVIAACASGGGATSAPTAGASPAATVAASETATAAATAAPGPVSTAPASFALTVAGDKNVTGTWTASFGVNCNTPTFTGWDIGFFAQSPDAQAVVLITLNPGSIDVSERHGAGANYTDREFHGAGVTAFDPAHGATFDSDVAIVPGTGQKPGVLGTITHVSGSVDCGRQTPGTSTVVVTGATPEGPVNGPFTRSRVTCSQSAQYGNSASIVAILPTGSTQSLLIIGLSGNGNTTLFTTVQSPNVQHSYSKTGAGTFTVTTTGAHLDFDFVQAMPPGASASAASLHLAGDVTCGT